MTTITGHFDVIVVGGGHAGTEAALAASRTGAKTLLLTQNLDTIGQMSCNPAIGGIGKGHLVREIDALGGAMAHATDLAGIQFRRLNASKGAAVRATRAQADRALYRQAIREIVEQQENLFLFQQNVADLWIEKETVRGVITQTGQTFSAPSVVLTVGTFLGGIIHIGQQKAQGGRAGCPASHLLADRLRKLPFRVGRLKTGTPPRIDALSVDYSKLEPQPGDTPAPTFSFLNTAAIHPQQIACHIAKTNTQTHQIIQDNLTASAMYSGQIEGVGPRYCPSIEDKIIRFAERESHQIFLEPEGLRVNEIYPNGLSTSLPFDIQVDFIRSIAGLEQAHITRPGYAIEYDYFDPRDLQPSLETTFLKGLFFAGQINGTTGYEEAAAQGLIAGLNAARLTAGKPSWTPKRSEAYIGVLIDDLITKGTREPYRMFTSRAEYRLQLREDNADLRLTPIGHELGLVNATRWQHFQHKQQQLNGQQQALARLYIHPNTPAAETFQQLTGERIEHEYNCLELLKRPSTSYQVLQQLPGLNHTWSDCPQVAEQIEIQTRYSGYIARQTADIERNSRLESLAIPADFDYQTVSGLSNEVIEKLRQTAPPTLGHAKRIPGMTPAAISLLRIFLQRARYEARPPLSQQA